MQLYAESDLDPEPRMSEIYFGQISGLLQLIVF